MSKKSSVIGIGIASYFFPMTMLKMSHGFNGAVTENYALVSLLPFLLVTVPWYFLVSRRPRSE